MKTMTKEEFEALLPKIKQAVDEWPHGMAQRIVETVVDSLTAQKKNFGPFRADIALALLRYAQWCESQERR